MHGEHGAPGNAVDGHGAAVRGRDGLHDGEAETRRAGGTRARGVTAREPFEDVREQVGRDALTVVLDVHTHPGAAPLDPRRDGRALRGVFAGVAEQVDEHLLETGRVTGDEGGFVGQVEAPVVVHAGRSGVTDGVHDERDEVGLLELQRPPGVQAREQQQVLHEQRHTARLGLDTAQGVPGVGSDLFSAASGELGVPADGGERSPQLVTGVRHELAHPHLALLACVQGAVNVVQHAVERGADLSDLGVRIALRLGHPLAQVDLAGVEREFGDPGGGVGDPAQGAGGEPDQDVTGDDGRAETGGGDADLYEDQRVDGVAHGVGGQRHVVAGAVPGRGVHHEVLTDIGNVHDVLAGGGHAGEHGPLGRRQLVGLHPLAGVAGFPYGDDRLGDGAVRADLGGHGVLLCRAVGDERVELVLVVGVHALPGPSERRPRKTLPRVEDLVAQLVVQMGPQRQCRHGADHRTDHGDEYHRRDDEPRPQRARLACSPCSLLRPRPSSSAHEAAGLIR